MKCKPEVKSEDVTPKTPGKRSISVPGGTPMSSGDLKKYGGVGDKGAGVGSKGYRKDCADPGTGWKEASKEWEERLRR